MKKSFLVLSIALLSFGSIFTACSSDDSNSEITTTQETTLTLQFQANNIESFKDLTVEILEINSGKQTTQVVTGVEATIKLAPGSYKIAVNGNAILSTGEEMLVGGNATIDIKDAPAVLDIPLTIKSFSEDFIIEEVFFTGVRTNEGKAYVGGKYFKLTNNTDKVLNTGGLLICQSNLLTTQDRTITPDIRTEAFAVKTVMMVPAASGKDVQPGDFIIIADTAINHNLSNVPGFDLTGSDYEYPNTENPALGQTDNPAVPNMDIVYSTLKYGMVLVHDRGFESFAIARFPEGVTKENWLTDYTYDYSYENQAGTITPVKSYKIPNAWIVDGYNASALQKWLYNPLDASIDSGWTGVGNVDSDPERYGKSIRRKVIGQMSNGKNIYKDTNNSTLDFNRDAEPSVKGGIVH